MATTLRLTEEQERALTLLAEADGCGTAASGDRFYSVRRVRAVYQITAHAIATIPATHRAPTASPPPNIPSTTATATTATNPQTDLTGIRIVRSGDGVMSCFSITA